MPAFGDMNADIKCVFDLLSGPTCWHVPQYQRPYVWSSREVDQLVADIWRYFEMSQGTPEGKSPKPKFVGVLVTAMNEGQELRQEIVDGQQRTITLILVVRAAVYLGHQLQNPRAAQNISESTASAVKEIDEIGRMLCRNNASTGDFGPLLTLFGRELSEWFSQTFLTENNLVLRDAFRQAILMQQQPPREKLVKLKGYFLQACNTAHKSLKGRIEATMGGVVKLAEFLRYLMRHTVVTHMETRDRESAFDIFDSINSTGVRLTELQKLKAFMSSGMGEISTTHSEKWNQAEEMIGRFSWGDATSEQGKLAAAEPLRIFLITIAEIAEAETANVLLESGHKPRWVTDLKGYFLHEFKIGVGNQRQELFEPTRKPRSKELALFFERHFNPTSTHAFCSFLDLEDQCWANSYLLEDDSFAKVRCQVQNIVALLRHLGHLGLDQAWIRPAYAFTNKYLCRTSEEEAQPPLPSAQEVLKFFMGLERLAAYIAFAVPRKKRALDVSDIAREASEKDVDLSAAEDDQIPYLQDVQLYIYRDLLTIIATKSMKQVLEWLNLRQSEDQLFADRFPSCFSTVKYKRRAIYAVLRAEVCLVRGQEKLHKGLIEQLPELLLNKSPRDAKKVTRAFSDAASYRQLVMDHIVPAHNTTLHSEEGYEQHGWDKQTYDELRDCLGNLTALAVIDDSSYRSRLDWSQKRTVYQEQPLKLTVEVAHIENVSPTYVRSREQMLRKMLKDAWSIPLSMELGRSASSASVSYGGRNTEASTGRRVAWGQPFASRALGTHARDKKEEPLPRRAEQKQHATWSGYDKETDGRIWDIERYLEDRGGYAHISEVGGAMGEKRWFLEEYFGIHQGWVYSWAEQETWPENRNTRQHNKRKNRAAPATEEVYEEEAEADIQLKLRARRERFGMQVPTIEVQDDEESDFDSERKKRARRERFGI